APEFSKQNFLNLEKSLASECFPNPNHWQTNLGTPEHRSTAKRPSTSTPGRCSPTSSSSPPLWLCRQGRDPGEARTPFLLPPLLPRPRSVAVTLRPQPAGIPQRRRVKTP